MTSPVIRIAELEIDPVHLDRYKALLAEEIEASVVAEPGVAPQLRVGGHLHQAAQAGHTAFAPDDRGIVGYRSGEANHRCGRLLLTQRHKAVGHPFEHPPRKRRIGRSEANTSMS